jgi:hypothetical protein
MKISACIIVLAAIRAVGAPLAHPDAIADANAKAAEIASKNPVTPVAVRTMAIVQVSVFDAVNTITGRYPALRAKLRASPGASVDAAVAAATRTALAKLMPAQQAAIDADYQAALKTIGDGPAKTAGIAVGEQAAAAVVPACADAGSVAPHTYRPPTTVCDLGRPLFPAVPRWGRRKPWVIASGDPVPAWAAASLTSGIWNRDFNEIKAVGGKTSTHGTREQTAIGKFGETTAPLVYWPVARSVAKTAGRDASDNARLLALAAMAMDDALIAVFDAKYTYNFWRPVTAIRNAPGDARDPGWMPFIDTPMHPEYPCAHCILAASLGAVLRAELGSDSAPVLTSASPTAGGAVHTWTSLADFVQEVNAARIYDGVHFRNSTEVGAAMGNRIGELVARSVPKATR